MAYEDELIKEQKQVNIVIEIDGEYYAQRQVDSGLVILNDNLIVDDPKINSVNVDIRRANTPVGSLTFKLKDELAYITNKIMADDNSFLEKQVNAYAGFITGSFDFSEYKKVATTNINSVTKIANGYSIRTKEVTGLLNSDSYFITTKLDISILAGSTTLDLQDASLFPTSGLININNEFIRYNGITDNTLENLTRGQLASTASDHNNGDNVYLVTELIDTNPIDMLLQLMLSKDGDGLNNPTYDVLKNGLGLTGNEVNISNFESIRDSNFSGELYKLYLYNELDLLKFIEKEILQPCNARLFSEDGKINITVLDQVTVSADVREVNEDVIISVPTWALSSDKIHNVIKLNYDYEEATSKFLSTVEIKDGDSINTFGEKKPLIFSFKGIKSSLDGNAIINKRALQLLNRLSTARGRVTMRTLFDVSDANIGEDVLLNHRFLPQQGGSLGIYSQLEVISKSLDLRSATCTFKLEYTSFSGIRLPFIAPSPMITSVIDQKTFTVPDGSCFKKDYALRLFDTLTNQYLPDGVNYIQSIEGNTITMVNPFDTTLSTDIRIKMADYDEASSDQKARYAFIGSNTGFFNDGTKSYQIIF